MTTTHKRRGIAAAGIGASASVLALVLTSLPASAAAVPPSACPEGSGAAGTSCVIHINDLAKGNVGAKVGLSVQLGTEIATEGSPGACTDARANRDNAANIESGTRGRLATANSNLTSARSALGAAVNADNADDATHPDPVAGDTQEAAVISANAAISPRVGDVATAQSAEDTAEGALVAAEAAVTRACNPPTTTLPPPPPPTTTLPPPPTTITLPPPPPGNTTIVNPPPRPGNTTIVNPPAAGNPGPVFVLPSPSGGNFTSPSVPSGSVATGDGSLAGTE